MPQFDSTFLTPMLFWSTVSFLLLLAVLWKAALPGILQGLEDRKERIKSDLDAAETLREESEKIKAEHEANLARAKADADELIARAQEKASALLADNEHKMKQEADRIVADAQRAIEQERGQAVGELRTLAADLAVTAAAKFVTAGLGEEAQLKLVDESLEQLGVKYNA